MLKYEAVAAIAVPATDAVGTLFNYMSRASLFLRATGLTVVVLFFFFLRFFGGPDLLAAYRRYMHPADPRKEYKAVAGEVTAVADEVTLDDE